MRLRHRLIFLIIYFLVLITIGRIITESFSFIFEDFWFAAGLLLLVLISLIDQPFFSTNANVFMNGAAGVSLILVETASRDFWWIVFLFWCLWLIITSYLLMWLNVYKAEFKNPIKELIEKVNREIGRPEALFSAFFLWGAIRQFGVSSTKIEPLFAFWVIFTIINIPGISRAIDKYLESLFKKQKTTTDVGDIYRILDPRVIEVKLNMECPNHIVGHNIQLEKEDGTKIAEGFVIDDRIISGNRIAKIATTSVTSQWNYIAQHPDRTVFSIQSINQPEKKEDVPISVVDVGSTIGSIKFSIHPDFQFKKGEIVWTQTIEKIKVYYQVTSANITEQNAIDGNFTRSVLVTANQLGIWQETDLRFEQFPWIPPSGHLIYQLSDDNTGEFVIPNNKIIIGNIPNSRFPVLAKIDDLVTHNTAIIGITGSGKSYLAFHLIESVMSLGIKVLVLDLTREYFLYLNKFNPTAIRSHQDVGSWFQGESLLGIYQFATSESYPHTTQLFIDAAFRQLSQVEMQPGISIPARLCIVFEEAHSLVPEWNQVADKTDIEFVNKTARTILQGRKFGMGSLIVTQRTANVTKSILNQCNTMIAMRSFDQTGLDFLSNYMGNEYSQAISTLPSRDAIIVGKSSSCQSPVIFTVPDFSVRWNY